jgi:hypothetical protein
MDIPAVRFPCRVAFEAGHEQSVWLALAGGSFLAEEDPSGSPAAVAVVAAALLLETLPDFEPLEPGDVKPPPRGVVRAVAPLCACDAFVDPAHPKWLRARVRSPSSRLVSFANPPASCSAVAERRANAREVFRDGHWTLAFADERTCSAAKNAMDAGAETVRAACRSALAALVERRARTRESSAGIQRLAVERLPL